MDGGLLTAFLLIFFAIIVLGFFSIADRKYHQKIAQQSKERKEREECEQQQWWENHERSNRKWTNPEISKSAKAANLPVRTDLIIIGPPNFVKTIHRLLDELELKALHRYYEVIGYLPKAVYEPEFNYEKGRWKGRSDGKFGFDGTNATYESFRWVFLHEAGHNLCGKRNNDWSENAASEYANKVTKELER